MALDLTQALIEEQRNQAAMNKYFEYLINLMDLQYLEFELGDMGTMRSRELLRFIILKLRDENLNHNRLPNRL